MKGGSKVYIYWPGASRVHFLPKPSGNSVVNALLSFFFIYFHGLSLGLIIQIFKFCLDTAVKAHGIIVESVV